MQTQCPHCQAVFRVTAALLNAADGHVRCSHCKRIFDAAGHLLKQAQAPAARSGKGRASIAEEDIPELLQAGAEPSRRSWGKLLFYGLAGLLLLACLAGQFFWFMQRDMVLQHPLARPWLESVCRTLGCVLPPTRNLNSIQVSERYVNKHPDIKNAVLVHIKFQNTGPFPQAYPLLQLGFAKENEQVFGLRRILPSEYLADPHAAALQMPPQELVHVKLEFENLVESMHTYSFSIDFL
ncbi:MAG: DUF3426 domain-containing protein [Gammaproteobacteria bacterium]|nr:DUF3426 domain-containing protein [Gammaproteobacteria bacterium]